MYSKLGCTACPELVLGAEVYALLDLLDVSFCLILPRVMWLSSELFNVVFPADGSPGSSNFHLCIIILDFYGCSMMVPT